MSATFESPVLKRATLLLSTAWVGSLWTIGYLVMPVLFKAIPDPTLAGNIAGRFFQIEAWFSVISALLLCSFSYVQMKRLPWLVVGMLFCTMLGYFILHPFMTNLRAAGLLDPEIKWRFGVLHGISSGFYLLQSVLGAILILEPVLYSADDGKKN